MLPRPDELSDCSEFSPPTRSSNPHLTSGCPASLLAGWGGKGQGGIWAAFDVQKGGCGQAKVDNVDMWDVDHNQAHSHFAQW